MATDYFLAAVFIPVLFVIAGLLLLWIFAKRAWTNKTVFGLRWGAILTGTLGALAGLYFYSATTSYIEAIERVAEHESLREQGALSLALGWSFYLFFLIAPFLLAVLALFVFPVLAALSWLRLVSASGVFLIAAIFIITNAGFTYLTPGNNWCEANKFRCVQTSVVDTLVFVLPIALGVVFGARLPLLLSQKAK